MSRFFPVLLLVGCAWITDKEHLARQDEDADGWSYLDDCDDADPSMHPEAEEVWYDGVDQDCDTTSDFDQDGDGHPALGWGDDCNDADPSIYAGATEQVGDGVDQDCDGWDGDLDGDGWLPPDDCAPDDGTISPDATETWYDGVDQDCDGESDYDQDGDNHDILPYGDDCDDEDPTIHPDVPDWVDGINNDCDELIDEG